MEERYLKLAFPHCKIISTDPPKILINPKKLVAVHVLEKKTTASDLSVTIRINSNHEAATRLNERHSIYTINWNDDPERKINSLILNTIANYCSMCGIQDYDCDFNDVADIASNTVRIAENLKQISIK